MSKILICQICNKSIGINGFGRHIKKVHHITRMEYHDTFLKKEGEGLCSTCHQKTEFRGIQGYAKFCSRKCSTTNKESNKVRGASIKKTLKDNPEITEERIKKFRDTLRKNPEIQLNINQKIRKWANENPEKVQERNKNIINAYRDNPEILKRRSISHRDYYKSITENITEESHYLYIMENLTRPIIKIGLCNERTLRKRTADLSRDFGESIPILLLKSTYKKIDDLETFLHKYFKEHCLVQPEKKSGRTEWFDIKIMEEAKLIASSRLLEC